MTTSLSLIREDFITEIGSIKTIVGSFDEKIYNNKSRIAAINAATLLLAAVFEEYIREIARDYARQVISRAVSLDKAPSDVFTTVWKRNMEYLSRVKFDNKQGDGREKLLDAKHQFLRAFDFCSGDLNQDIYTFIVHNENNMTPKQINQIFKLIGRSDICKECCAHQCLLEYFGESEQGKTHGKLLSAFDAFFQKRNAIAHSIGSVTSSSSEEIINYIELMKSFSLALNTVLEFVNT